MPEKNILTNTIALAGNPNVGKSTVFNALTGMKQHTGNWPGKTVLLAHGQYKYKNENYTLVDLPGCYSLYSASAEEETARDFILNQKTDVVVVVCDATCLERNLMLVLQIAAIKKVVVCVNLMDEAEKKKIRVDIKYLSRKLGVPVVATAASTQDGINELLQAVYETKSITKPTVKIINAHDPVSLIKTTELICRRVVRYENTHYHDRDRFLDKIFMGKKTGFAVMLLALLVVFWITLTGAQYPSDWIAHILFGLEPYIQTAFDWAGVPVFVSGMLVQGIYRVLAWVVSVMLPPMAIFFPLFMLMEDSGYLPRVAFNLDKAFRKCGACGKQSLTMMMGFGCNAAGIIGCRIIQSPRERLIAVITNNFVPCNGRFPALIAIISMFFIAGEGFIASSLSAVLLTGAVLLGIAMTFVVSRFLSATWLKGMPSSFILELPPYRRPQIGKVIIRSIIDRTLFVLTRAVVVAAPAGLVIYLMANTYAGDISVLSRTAGFLDPFAKILGMDGVILLAFILGWPANEIVIPIIIMAYLSAGSVTDITDMTDLKTLLVANGWTTVTAISTMLFMIMHWPCSTTCLTIRKETQSVKWTGVSILVPTVVGMLVCFLFATMAGFLL